jgi:hypothetical protein
MHCSGRLTLIKTTMTAMPIYTSISVGLSPWFLKVLHKIMHAFLWTRTDMVQNGKNLVAWNRVQRPLHLGGLGIIDL